MIVQNLCQAGQADASAARTELLKAAFVALALGLGLVYLVGFSSADAAHNAAHDTRHSTAFPCH